MSDGSGTRSGGGAGGSSARASSARGSGTRRRAYVAVIGSGDASDEQVALGEQVGSAVARAGAILVCGGLRGVMEAACRGAKANGGTTVGILPGSDRRAANPHVDIAVATGLGEARNAVVVASADAVVAVGGEFGTLSEIALALRAGKPVVGLDTWELHRDGQPVDGVVPATDAAGAVGLALRLATTTDGFKLT
ncbi:MAG: TIGR00725 family protein [Acidimicrobiales bacterium]